MERNKVVRRHRIRKLAHRQQRKNQEKPDNLHQCQGGEGILMDVSRVERKYDINATDTNLTHAQSINKRPQSRMYVKALKQQFKRSLCEHLITQNHFVAALLLSINSKSA